MKSLFNRFLNAAGYELRALPGPRKPKQSRQVHFLHIGKAAGTQISASIKELNHTQDAVLFHSHGHDYRFGHLPEGEDYFFSIRHPVSRFVSGFYSRKRKGQPRRYVEWTPHEARTYEKFEHANDLAEALFTPGERGEMAFQAMRSVRHLAENQVDWFTQSGFFLSVRPPVYIVRQENFDADFQELLSRLGLSTTISDSTRAASRHANDYSNTPGLSPLAVKNLEQWYRQDMEQYRLCESWLTAVAETGTIADG